MERSDIRQRPNLSPEGIVHWEGFSYELSAMSNELKWSQVTSGLAKLSGLKMNSFILGNPWCFYSDEAGKCSTKVKDSCFCFATIAIPGTHDEITKHLRKIPIGKKNAKEKEIKITKNAIEEISGRLSLTYFPDSISNAFRSYSKTNMRIAIAQINSTVGEVT